MTRSQLNRAGDFQMRRLFERCAGWRRWRSFRARNVPRRRNGTRRDWSSPWREVELVVQFLLPLIHERRHGEHEEALYHAAREPFLERKAGFDGFAQADFIREQRPSAQRPEHAQYGADLVIEALDAAIRQRDQIVGLIGYPPLRGAFAQEIAAEVFERERGFLKREFGQFDAHRHGWQRPAFLGRSCDGGDFGRR